jgi:diguanylate cyclase (GGDEF)-like protein
VHEDLLRHWAGSADLRAGGVPAGTRVLRISVSVAQQNESGMALPKMIDHKDRAALKKGLHEAFNIAFGRKTFEAAPSFGTQSAIQNPIGPAELAKLQPHLAPLATSGLIAQSGNLWTVTQWGLDWGRIFQLRHDGVFVVFGSTVDREAWPIYQQALVDFENSLIQLTDEIQAYLGVEHTTPARITSLLAAVRQLQSVPDFPGKAIPLQTYHEAAVLACRQEMLRLRARKEELEFRARDRHVLQSTLFQLESLQSVLDIPDLVSARAASKPRITDFVNVGIIEASRVIKESRGRAADEKFGILSAPTLFSVDFAKTADGAFSRDRSFAVGFIDIDKFKDFNSDHLETVVDRDMLPYFMRAVEAYCYARAYAYRQGGDEYLVLLHNANSEEARVFFTGLQSYIARIRYPSAIKRSPKVSIGVHVIDGNNEVTEFEAKKLANEAKDMAKKAGRNCVRFSSDLHQPPPAEIHLTTLDVACLNRYID